MQAKFHIICLWLTSYLQFTDSKGGNKEKVKMIVTGLGTRMIESSYSLKCIYDEGVVEAGILWKKDSNLIYVDHGTIWKKPGISGTNGPVTGGTKSHVINIPHLHSSDAGVYKCIVTTIRGEEISAEITLVVEPHIHVVKINDQHSIRCAELEFNNTTMKGNVVWQKGTSKVISVNGIIVGDKLSFKLDSRGDLFIRNMTEDLIGEYSCYINGEKFTSVFINIPVEIKPHRSLLAGKNGIIFGVVLAVAIVAILATIKIVENRI